jgi:hypothetical protein
MRVGEALPITAIVAALVVAAYLAVRFNAQEPTIQTSDFRNAATAEIRDEKSAIVLRGTFMLEDEEDDDIERKAALATVTSGEVMGEAEVEFATEIPVDQEVEFAARGLVAGATYTMIVDGREMARVNADERGRIAVEFDVPLPGAPASR